MPIIGPIKRRALVKYLRLLGFVELQSGGKHQRMKHADGRRVMIPNPHEGDIAPLFLKKLLKQAEVEIAQWEDL
jgi:predicted RNA binding protein YcfA (HicA-like mRNA interferase family)